ncbi:uncharacterized protein [Aegilops tauschii subsp. strangulata]|uniref:uncharacterized protein n=1 Tax=Aegilops tauschii subsp. strangulata TaxID=200361 RepID=UPI003CC89B22
MRIARLALQIRSLLTGSPSPRKPFLSRHVSSFPKWDCTPASNRSWHSREIDVKDLEDPISFYQRNPIFDNILTNKLVGRPTSKKDKTKINEFRAKICRMDQEILSELAAFGIRSLATGVLRHHVGGIHLGGSVNLSNLRICKSSGEWILLNTMPKESTETLTLKHRSEDWIAIRKLVKDVVEAVCGSQIVYPVDFQHWLDQLAKPNPRIFLILYHTVFLRLNPRFYYHIQMDQFLRKEPNYIKHNLIDESELIEMLRNLGDLRGLLSFAEMHELLKSCMDHHDRAEPTAASESKSKSGAVAATATPTTASKRRGNKGKTVKLNATSKATNVACQGLSQSPVALRKGHKHFKGGKTTTRKKMQLILQARLKLR